MKKLRKKWLITSSPKFSRIFTVMSSSNKALYFICKAWMFFSSKSGMADLRKIWNFCWNSYLSTMSLYTVENISSFSDVSRFEFMPLTLPPSDESHKFATIACIFRFIEFLLPELLLFFLVSFRATFLQESLICEAKASSLELIFSLTPVYEL